MTKTRNSFMKTRRRRPSVNLFCYLRCRNGAAVYYETRGRTWMTNERHDASY